MKSRNLKTYHLADLGPPWLYRTQTLTSKWLKLLFGTFRGTGRHHWEAASLPLFLKVGRSLLSPACFVFPQRVKFYVSLKKFL